MALATRLSGDSPKFMMAVWKRAGQVTQGRGVWGSNDGTKEVGKLTNPLFLASLPQTQESRGTLDNQDKTSGENNGGFYNEVVSGNERKRTGERGST